MFYAEHGAVTSLGGLRVARFRSFTILFVFLFSGEGLQAMTSRAAYQRARYASQREFRKDPRSMVQKQADRMDLGQKALRLRAIDTELSIRDLATRFGCSLTKMRQAMKEAADASSN